MGSQCLQSSDISSNMLSLLVFTALLSQCVVEAGFFYSTGYYPFGGYSHIANPYIGHTFTVPHAIPTISYSGCRNVHGALVPCALPTPLITAVGAPALVETEVPAEAAPEESGEAAPEAAADASAETAEERRKRSAEAEADADPYLLYGYGGHLSYGLHGFGYPYHGLPYAHGIYAHTGCKNYLGVTVPCA